MNEFINSFFTNDESSFEGQKSDEVLLVFARRHWVTQLPFTITSFFAIFLPIILIILGGRIIQENNLANLFALFWIMYGMFVWFYLFYKLTLYVLDTWIVTNHRVIDSLHQAMFRRKVSELQLDSIQDVSVNTNGILESYMDFGNVEIQTGATAQRFLFEQVPKPIEIKDKIMNAMHADKIVHGN